MSVYCPGCGHMTVHCDCSTDASKSAVQPVATDDRLYTVFEVTCYEEGSVCRHIIDGFRVAAWVDPKRIDALKEIFLEAVKDQEVVE